MALYLSCSENIDNVSSGEILTSKFRFSDMLALLYLKIYVMISEPQTNSKNNVFWFFLSGKIKHWGIKHHWFLMQNLMNEVSLVSNMQGSKPFYSACTQQMAVKKGHCKCVFCMCRRVWMWETCHNHFNVTNPCRILLV